MTNKGKADTQVAGTVLNPKHVHGRVEKVTENGVWLEGQGMWYHFDTIAMRNQTLPRPGQLVVCAQNKAGHIVSIAMQHEMQAPPEQPNTPDPDDYRKPTQDPRVSETDEAYFSHLARKDAGQQNTAPEQPSTLPDDIVELTSVVGYRIRTDALSLAISLLNLEAHYGIDRDDVFRVAKEVIRWIQTKGEE
jgi:hypothetical protein